MHSTFNDSCQNNEHPHPVTPSICHPKTKFMKDHSQKGFQVEKTVSDFLENTYLPIENTGNFTEK